VPGEPVPVGLCADDFGIAPGVDDGIAALAEAGRISAVSCIAVLPRWPAAARRLAPLVGHVEIGLHLTLTGLAPCGPMPRLAPDGRLPPLGRLGRAAFAGRLDGSAVAGEIAAEIARQFDAFAAALGHTPDFVDGHQHVHQFPGIREPVAAALAVHAGSAWIRNTATTPGRLLRRGIAVPRAAFLAGLGTAARRHWRRAGLTGNADFAGVRNFSESAPYRTLMRRFLADARPGLLVMCHPGTADAELAGRDPVTAPRAAELAYLGGPAFADDLAAAGCRLVRPRDAAGLRRSSAGG
jgi:predicted glycoside hydrolase/deacetylase ChbG (UPF0249 family)